MKKSSLTESNNLILLGVVACFVLSGFAALLYQTAWMRQFSLVFGTSELAVAAVLSAYMGGLSLGAIVAARYVHLVTRPVLFYGVLEAGIAISALAVPWLLKLASLFYLGLFGGQPEPVDASGLGQSFFYLLIAFVVLSIPTTFMGATLPLLTKYVVQRKEQIGTRVGLLYATNTLGAIGGTLVAGFLLLPWLGLNGTVVFGVVVNLLVFIIAALIAKAIGDHSQLNQEDVEGSSSGDSKASALEDIGDRLSGAESAKNRLWILPLILISGANSFVYEVLWTRLLGHILGGSITAFATMLAGFLSGIALGSAIAARFASSRERATFWFVVVQVGIAFTSIFIYQILPLVVPETPGLKGNVLLAILVLLPATIFIGATFPLAVRILATSQFDAAASSAKIYSWNTVGAIAGATLAAFFLIPALKYEGAIRFAVLLNLFIAVAAALLIGRQNRSLVVGAMIVSLGVGLFYRPEMPGAILRSSPVFVQNGGEIRFYEVGRSATVLVVEENGFLNLRTNGLPEASASLKGAPPAKNNQQLLSTMPVLARPDVETMLIVGLGAGIALEGVPASVDEVDVIELEPQVVEANRFYGAERAKDPLIDPRFNLVINDARSAMTLTSKRYDAIVSQPSHPWTAGASHLYTREFMQLAKDHLNEGGVYLQWMNTQFVDEFLLRSLCATMLDVYSHVRIYQWNSEALFFLGSEEPLDVEENIALTGRPLSDDPLGYLEKGVGSVEDVIAALTLDQKNLVEFAKGGQLITDNNNHMATMSARVMDNGEALTSQRLNTLIKPYDPLLQTTSDLRANFPIALNYPHISRRLESTGLRQRAIDLAGSLVDQRLPQGLAMIGMGQANQGDQQESQSNLLLALAADPQDQQIRYALLEPWFAHIAAETAVPEYVSAELVSLQGSGADTLNAWLASYRGDLQQIVELDRELASVLPSDLWYRLSVKLRTDWRIKVTTPELQPRMALEAIALIDSAIVFFQDFEFYTMRMKAALVAADLHSVLETGRRLSYLISYELDQVEFGYFQYPEPRANARLSELAEMRDTLNLAMEASDLLDYEIQLALESIDGIALRISELISP